MARKLCINIQNSRGYFVVYYKIAVFKRDVENIFSDKDFGRQMRFIAGPRQVGKTTLAKKFLEKVKCIDFYYNWDDKKVRDKFRGK